MADGSVEFFVALLGEMKIKAANATEYAERLAADDYDRELFLGLTPDVLKSDLQFSGGDALRFQKFKEGGAGPAAGGAGAAQGAGGGAAAQQQQQGSRVAAGLAALTPMGSLAARFQPLLAQEPVDFLDAIRAGLG